MAARGKAITDPDSKTSTMKQVEEREVQKNYWIEHSANLTVEAMMLDSKASDLDKEERPENESINGHHKNVKFMCADVTSPDLKFSEGSVDLIFSNWLLMYLSDKEVENLAERMVKWLKVGGYIFFRESCFHQSGDSKRKYNPTHYRSPDFTLRSLKSAIPMMVLEILMNSLLLAANALELISLTVQSDVFVEQICWIWQKVSSQDDKGFQQFLDNVQYKCNGILRYERVFGKGFVSTGGIETTKEFVAKLDLKPGQKVLDVGCGIGGGDFYMAENFDVEVVGIDLSINMISIALESAIGLKCNVEFEVADCTKKTYPDNTFDVIYSRDTILHIQDKPALFRSFFKWLKPGGKVLISDYCKNAGTPSPEFSEYIKQRGYDLLMDAGFDDVIAEDRTDQFNQVLQRELNAVEKEKDEFIQDFSEEDYNDIVGGWKAKLIRAHPVSSDGACLLQRKNEYHMHYF
ncbi:hypothetical protein GH714_022616 [Hevea brasiliensis]|uniref:phosphoethanolamine N-methyltransferase n=1 Tax=Hevea brasiliensis TaxID=3981 RepID=A0A6A6MY16_HEVBR|nr:hypothetical protein GH714_022616 [Hevea brasiliensis]